MLQEQQGNFTDNCVVDENKIKPGKGSVRTQCVSRILRNSKASKQGIGTMEFPPPPAYASLDGLALV